MSNGSEDGDGGFDDPEAFHGRLADAEESLAAAETEADLDDVEATLEGIEADLEDANFPEPEPEGAEDEDEDDEEEAVDPREEIEDELGSLREDLEDLRGPYAEDVTGEIQAQATRIDSTRWTETGVGELREVVDEFLAGVDGILGTDRSLDGADQDALVAALEDAREAVESAGLDPDDDAETIADLLETTGALEAGIDDSEEFGDLTVREQFEYEGFYDVLSPQSRKDFPPEWSAVKIYERMGEVEPLLTALERLGSDFMEENVMDSLEHMAPPEAFDAMHQRAQRRSKQPIRILGRIGDDRACDTLEDFLGGGDVSLEKETLRALGAIGSEESTQPIANRLVAENPEIRSHASRALGMIGDARAIEPLGRVLDEDDADEVRASAAWALNQIGTEDALATAAEYADDRSYVVQAEAEKAAGV